MEEDIIQEEEQIEGEAPDETPQEQESEQEKEAPKQQKTNKKAAPKKATQTTSARSDDSQHAEGGGAAGDERDAGYWKSKYDGLQGYVINLKNQIASKEQALMDLEQQVADLKQQVEELGGAKAELETETEQLREYRKLSERKAAVRKVITEKHPELAGLFDDGLMMGVEDLQGESLMVYLDKFAKRLNASALETLDGTVPTPPTDPSEGGKFAATEEQLLDFLLSHDPSTPEWTKASQQYEAVLRKRAAKGGLQL